MFSSPLIRTSAVILAVIFLQACAAIKQIVDVQKPTANVTGVSLQNVDLKQATLLVDVEVANPNGFALKAAAFDLDLDIAESSVARVSQQDAELNIAANDKAVVQLPLSLKFEDIASALGSLDDYQAVPYAVLGSVTMNLPVLGNISLPVEHKDTLPVPRMPAISFVDASLKSVDWSGAEFALVLDVNNPNAFDLNLKSLSYALSSDGKALCGGDMKEIAISQGETRRLEIPLDVSLTNLGISLFRMLSGNDDVTLGLDATADLVPELGIWKPEPLSYKAERRLSR